MNSREIIRRLKRAGFTLDRIQGSHHIYERKGRIAVAPHSKKDLAIGTVRSIERQAGVNLR